MSIIKALYRITIHPNNTNHKYIALLRVIWWRINQVTFKIPALIQLTPETKCICYPDSSFGSLIVYEGWPEYAEMEYIYHNLGSDDVFVDVGSGIGEMSLIAASKITKGRIFAFEPTQQSRERLYENVLLNNLVNTVRIFDQALSSKKGKSTFRTTKISETNHISHTINNEQGNIEVRVTTLDHVIRKEKISQIKILKIDVEGAEYDVLLGAKKALLGKKIAVIIVELNKNSRNYGHSNTKTLDLLNSCGYKTYILKEGGKLSKIPLGDIISRILNIVAILPK